MIAESIDSVQTVKDEAEILRKAAEARGTIVVSYDPSTLSLSDLSKLIATTLASEGELKANHLAFASHGRSNEIFLTKNQPITKNTLSINGGNNPVYTFWEDMQDLIVQGGRIDLLGCRIAAKTEGKELIKELETITGLNVAASTDPTGHASLGGNWILETEGKLNVSDLYFAPSYLDNWNHTLGAVEDINCSIPLINKSIYITKVHR